MSIHCLFLVLLDGIKRLKAKQAAFSAQQDLLVLTQTQIQYHVRIIVMHQMEFRVIHQMLGQRAVSLFTTPALLVIINILILMEFNRNVQKVMLVLIAMPSQ